MATTKAQREASRRYDQDKVEEIKLRVPKGRKASILRHAADRGESANAFICRAIGEAMERERRQSDPFCREIL